MARQPKALAASRAPVLLVAADGVPDGGQVHPDLVRAPGLEPDPQERRARQAPLQLEVGHGLARPVGRHHYVFKLYALDREVGLDKPTKYDFDRKLTSALVLAEAKLVGVYQRDKAAGAA